METGVNWCEAVWSGVNLCYQGAHDSNLNRKTRTELKLTPQVNRHEPAPQFTKVIQQMRVYCGSDNYST